MVCPQCPVGISMHRNTKFNGDNNLTFTIASTSTLSSYLDSRLKLGFHIRGKRKRHALCVIQQKW